jgi:hypothetical protein
MEKIKTSGFTSTTLASVTIDTLKNTPIWKKHVNANGVIIPVKNSQGHLYTAREEDLVRAALYALGYDEKAEQGFTKRRGTYVVRSSKDSTKGVVTQIYDFRVRKGHSMETFFMRNSFVHIDAEQSNEFIDLAGYGLEYYEITPRKSDKRDQDNDLTSQAADSSESFATVA